MSVPSPGISEKFSAGGSRVFGIDRAPDPGEVEVEEPKGMAMGGLPAAYLDAWARLQCQRPAQIAEATWRQAIDDAGRFLDQLVRRVPMDPWRAFRRSARWQAGGTHLVHPVVGHEPVLPVLRPHSETTGWRHLGDHLT